MAIDMDKSEAPVHRPGPLVMMPERVGLLDGRVGHVGPHRLQSSPAVRADRKPPRAGAGEFAASGDVPGAYGCRDHRPLRDVRSMMLGQSRGTPRARPGAGQRARRVRGRSS